MTTILKIDEQVIVNLLEGHVRLNDREIFFGLKLNKQRIEDSIATLLDKNIVMIYETLNEKVVSLTHPHCWFCNEMFERVRKYSVCCSKDCKKSRRRELNKLSKRRERVNGG